MDSFGVYLKEIARYPLLNGTQEIELFRSISAAAALTGQHRTSYEAAAAYR
jgi:hypothetical protein